ncbi:hypothetical protein Pla110_41420 [Polystyrenella longa]|uniref:DUF1552 domain-containing protein n=1 Tax=Polystyrenella longa TaxID=2528007 RepID=A0A518CT31_9PLAN|nr:DUF1552 domain-containing protein [Polystyrenella longa]QDU82387.1 hypothetical protein Pla110_41420 [Polystyrenella longa]
MFDTSRRQFLCGLGVTMALPWMESLKLLADEKQIDAATGEAPKRFGVLFSGNGFHHTEWWAKGAGAEMELGRVLEPLQSHREKMLFIKGLYNEEALKGNIHSSQTGNLLSGAPLASGGDIHSGTSVDQVLAQTYGKGTKVPSLVLGCEKSNPAVHKNYSMLYSSHISWSSPTTPTPLEVYPALAFDRMFRQSASAADQSVLDAVLEDASDLRRTISKNDRRKLDEYLNSVREVEQRIDQANNRGEFQGWRPTLIEPNIPRPTDGIPQDIAEHMRLMCDILVLAFQTDTTRICTLKLNNDHSSLRFPNLNIDYMIHHLLSHQESEDWLRVNQFFVEQLAYIADKLDAVEEGERTALDNSILLFCSSMLTGGHIATDLPVVIVGRGGGNLETGRVLDYSDKPNRKMCSLYLSLMEKYGVQLDRFGDSTERLSEV